MEEPLRAIYIKVPSGEYRRIKVFAAHTGMSMQMFLRCAAAEYMKQFHKERTRKANDDAKENSDEAR